MLVLMLMMIVTVAPVQEVFQGFHLDVTTDRSLDTAKLSMCCARNTLLWI